MAKGRKAIPSNIHKLHGTHRGDRHSGEIKVESVLPDPPDRLTPVGAEEWRRLAPELNKLGVLAEIDITTLEMYCTVFARWVNAEKMISLEGEVSETPNGYQQQGAWLQIANNCIKQMQSLCAEFGMTPATRARMRLIKAGPEQLDLLTLLDKASKTAANG